MSGGLNKVVRFLGDWRNVGVYCAAVLLTLMLILTIDNVIARREYRQTALQAVGAARSISDIADANNKRLQSQVAGLSNQVIASTASQSELTTQATALADQVRSLGARPVVTLTTRPTTVPTTTTPRRSSVTTTTTRVIPTTQRTTTTTRPRTTTTAKGKAGPARQTVTTTTTSRKTTTTIRRTR